MPTNKVHWFNLAERRLPNADPACPLNVSMIATVNSGASEASGASHWTRRNSLIPSAFPVFTSPSQKISAIGQHHAGGQ